MLTTAPLVVELLAKASSLGVVVRLDWRGSKHVRTAENDVSRPWQAVSHPSRVHLDIETDDIDAEVARLEQLGARRVQFIRRWWVMEAPTGQRFCVVRPQRGDFDAAANVWDDVQARPGP